MTGTRPLNPGHALRKTGGLIFWSICADPDYIHRTSRGNLLVSVEGLKPCAFSAELKCFGKYDYWYFVYML
jgi:hypothetical protein